MSPSRAPIFFLVPTTSKRLLRQVESGAKCAMALRASFFDVAVVRVRVWKPINPIIPEATDQDGGKCDPVNYNF